MAKSASAQQNTSRQAATPPPNPTVKPRRSPVWVVLGIIGGFVKWVLSILITLTLIGALTASIVACYGAVYIKNVVIPQSSVELSAYTLGENSVIYYLDSSTGEYEVLRTLHSEQSSSVWVDYSDIPEYLLNAAVAIEDKRFYQHSGVDWWRTLGAVKGLLTGSDSYGGSTITQQLIKNLTGNDDVTVKRKVTEIFQALEFEKSHSKSEILEYYLNIIYLGEGCNGIGSAAQVYFGKDVSELDLAECAALIGITNNPSKYDPLRTSVMKVKVTDEDGNYVLDENGDYVYTEQTHAEANKERQEAILWAMYNQGYITEEERDAAIAEELQFVTSSDDEDEEDDSSDVFSWFEDALITQVLEDLVVSGYSEDAAKLMLYSGGLSIYTTLDPSIQAIVDEVYEDESNFNYASSSGQQLQSSITIIDNSTGAVVAIAGGVGEKTGSLVYNRATQAKRQPGSSIKPLSVYAPAIELGLVLPSSTIDDVPFTYDEETSTAWPVNSYKYYNGLTTVAEAVRRSSNAAAVQLLDNLGLETSFNFLKENFGITTLIESRTTTSGTVQTDIAYSPLALGGLTSGATNLEMTSAYAAFARGGTYTRGYFYTSVVSPDGTVLLSNDGSGTQAVSASTAYYITQMLEEVVESGTGTAAKISGVSVAGKTGTTSNNYDRWFCGYTPYYTASVWSGYETNEQITTSTNVSAVTWQIIMSRIHATLPSADFETPGETVTVTVCKDSGLLPTSACKADQRGSRTTTAVFLVGDEPTTECTVHTYATVCTYSTLEGGVYQLAGTSVSLAYTKTVSVLNINRDYNAIGVLPKDYLYTLPWLVLQGYAGYNATYEEVVEEEPATTTTTDTTTGTTDTDTQSTTDTTTNTTTNTDTGTTTTTDTTTEDTGGQATGTLTFNE